MRREAVESSSVAAVGYAAQSRTLEIEFLKGGIYQYVGVPAEAFAALMAAPSKGRHVNSYIKGRYGYQRVASP